MIKWILLLVVHVMSQKLIQVQILIRHGARTQIYGLYNPQNISSDDMGQLTGVGIRQHYILGQALKKEYLDEFQLFGTEDFTNQNLLHVQTTNYNRTIMSAHSLIYGMTKQNQSAQINKSVVHMAVPPLPDMQPFVSNMSFDSLPNGYWPITIHTTIEEYDTTLLGYEPITCPHCQTFRTLNQLSEDYKNLNSQWSSFFTHLQTKQLNITNITQGAFIADDIRCNQVNGDPIPNLSEEDLLGLDYIRSLFYQTSDYRLYEQVRFQATPFIKKLLSNLGIGSLKFQLFSAHDNNIFLLLNLLNLTNWKCVNDQAIRQMSIFNNSKTNYSTCPISNYPEFASNAIFEVWSRSNESSNLDDLYVKFRFNGIYYPICPGGALECAYSNFKQQMESLIDHSYDSLCQISKISQHSVNSSYKATLAVIHYTLIIFYLIIILSTLVGTLYIKRILASKNNKSHKIQLEELQA